MGKLGLSALDFVKLICANFNEIRKGTGNSYLLVILNKKLAFVAAIDLNYSIKKGFWEAKTAEPRRVTAVLKKALIWEGAKHPNRENEHRTN